MARKRYVSTEISIDKRVRQLAERSEFGALLYTWMIPHALDDGTITADPDELLMQVVPGFRWRTAEDVATAVAAMVELGLVRRMGDRVKFPEKAFFQYQSYIASGRRPSDLALAPQNAAPPTPSENGAAERRESPRNAAEPFFAVAAPQNRAPVSGSSPVSGPVSGPVPVLSKPPEAASPPHASGRAGAREDFSTEFSANGEETTTETAAADYTPRKPRSAGKPPPETCELCGDKYHQAYDDHRKSVKHRLMERSAVAEAPAEPAATGPPESTVEFVEVAPGLHLPRPNGTADTPPSEETNAHA